MCFVNDREESDEEEEDIKDEPISNYDEGLEGYHRICSGGIICDS